MLQLLQTPLVKTENDLLRDVLSRFVSGRNKFVSVIIIQEQMHTDLMSARYKYTVTDVLVLLWDIKTISLRARNVCACYVGPYVLLHTFCGGKSLSHFGFLFK